MNNGFNIANYSLKIGSIDIIETQISPLLSDSPENEINIENANRKLQEVLKETRVRIGTLLKTDNVSFLIGAGASISVGGISLANIPKKLEFLLISKAGQEVKTSDSLSWIQLFYSTVTFLCGDIYTYENRQSQYLLEEDKNIQAIPLNLEDYLSHLYMWLAGIGESGNFIIIKTLDNQELVIEKGALKQLIKKITSSLTDLLNLPNNEKDNPLKSHRRFIKKILTRPLNLRRANLFTLNYDTLLEQGADAEGAVLVDGFVGTLKRVFRPESYNLDFYFPAQTTEGRVHRFDRALHLYKLHGSITWHRCAQSWENPYGIYATFFNQNCQEEDVLIYPSPLKYGQALGLPYSELFRRFGNAVVQPQSVLFTIGYGFGDEHVNALIRQALAIPSFTIVIIDPDPKNHFVDELAKLEDERVWIIKGWELGAFEHFVQKLMPDLREEEIEARVIRTFSKLVNGNSASNQDEEQNYGE